MDLGDEDSSLYHLPPSVSFEIRLFYVRVSPCLVDLVPDHLKLFHIRREIGVLLEINGTRIPASESAMLALRRDRVDKEALEVTYVSTDSVRVTGGLEFEICEGKDMMLCGVLERMEVTWSMDCYMVESAVAGDNSVFFKPRMGLGSPSIEVYIAGCCSGAPVILTKTTQVSPRRKATRRGILDVIPENEEVGMKEKGVNGFIRQGKLQITEAEADDDYEPDGKIRQSFYSEEMYPGEDGQLSWFNAGVRVGVGIGLGMCVGIGIGVGLLMRSYQATTRNLRRRFL